MTRADPLMRLVPLMLRPIAERLGIGAAIEVARKVGGRRVLVPNRPRPTHRLAMAIGLPAALILAELNAGYCSMPRARRLLAVSRDETIRADKRSANDIATAHGLTERHVRAIRNASRRRSRA